MSYPSDHDYEGGNALDTRRRHANSRPRLPPLRSLLPSFSKRRTSDDWGADVAESFCTPRQEEWTWNRKPPSEWFAHGDRGAVNRPTHDESARGGEQYWRGLVYVKHIHEHRAVVQSEHHWGDDSDEQSARQHRVLLMEEERIVQLREELQHMGCRQSEYEGRPEMGVSGDGELGVGVEGDQAKEGGNSNNKDATDFIATRSAEPFASDLERTRESNPNSQNTTPMTNSRRSSPSVQLSADEERNIFEKARARMQKWQRSVTDDILRQIDQVRSCRCYDEGNGSGLGVRRKGRRHGLMARILHCVAGLGSQRHQKIQWYVSFLLTPSCWREASACILISPPYQSMCSKFSRKTPKSC